MRKAANNVASNDNAMSRLTTFVFLALVLTLAVATFPSETFAQGGPPPGGIIYYGNATVSGVPVPDGHTIIARVGDYESKPATVTQGRYESLSVAAEPSLAGQTINFFLGDVQADQTDTYQPHGIPEIKQNFDLTFSALPEPTPAPTAIPTNTPDTPPAPTAPPPSPTPEVAEPMVFASGLVFIRGTSEAPTNSILVARIGDSYQSEPAAAIATDGTYGGLVVDPGDTSFEGSEIRFFLNGIPARTTAIYQSGKLERTFDILFTEYPTPLPTHTPVPTNTPVPTPVPPTSTPVPTNTPVPTPVPPTSTPVPTNTPVPTPVPTNTPAPSPTSAPPPTVAPPTTVPPPTPTTPPEESGGCFSTTNVSPLTGAANALLLIAPLGIIAGLRRARRGRTGS